MVEKDLRFKQGDKVVPIQKSMFGPLDKSTEWRWAKKAERSSPFLYVVKYGKKIRCSDDRIPDYILNHKNDLDNGDFFMECDLVSFEDFYAAKLKLEKKRRFNLRTF